MNVVAEDLGELFGHHELKRRFSFAVERERRPLRQGRFKQDRRVRFVFVSRVRSACA